jgi:hypothetical protein
LIVASAVGAAAWFCLPAHAEVKKVAYPEVKVTIDTAYKPDAAFEQMHAAFARAVNKKDLDALSKLVAPTFLWTIGGEPAEKMDLGRDAVHNFKVVFGSARKARTPMAASPTGPIGRRSPPSPATPLITRPATPAISSAGRSRRGG